MAAPRAFFAYPSVPAIRREAVTAAARQIEDQAGIQAVTWEQLRGTGRLLITKVLEAIDDCDLFVADVTEPNDNVLFELGYAIATRKKVWLLRDTSIEEGSRWWKQARALTPIEYSSFKNSVDIVTEYWQALPFESSDFFSSALSPSLHSADTPTILYLKSNHETEAEARVTPRILELEKRGIRPVIADPQESAFETLAWYAENIYRSAAVVAHFCSDGRVGHVLHNSRLALLSGFARGLDRPLLMLAEVGYDTPLDYMDYLKSYLTGAQCKDITERWLAENLAPVFASIKSDGERRRRTQLADELKSIDLGEHVAEHERVALDDYFVETAQYLEIIDGSANLFVGQKGTGKTANLYAAAAAIADDKRNFVCVIKPPSYELADLIRLIRQYKAESRGYLVESIWKFLVYSEIARAAYEDLLTKPSPAPQSVEANFIQFVEQSAAFVLDDFAVRLEDVVTPLLAGSVLPDAPEGIRAERSRISEGLHASMLRDLRQQIGLLLSDRQRVAVLVDNLDKSWERGIDVDETSMLILGLLSSVGRIEDDFQHQDHWRDPVNVTVTVFLRSDIWEQVKRVAREPDKIPVTFLRWDDPDLLRRVVEGRYTNGRPSGTDPAQLWAKYFPKQVRGLPPDDFILRRVLPRPRDVIFLVKQAIANAINARRDRVDEDDVLSAENSYSQFAFEALVVENGVRFPKIETLLFEFAGAVIPMTHDDVLETIGRGLPDDLADSVFVELLRMSFLGVIDKDGHSRFASNPDDDRRLAAVVRRGESGGSAVRLTVHPAFRRYLDIADSVNN